MIEKDARGNVVRFACTVWGVPPSKKNSQKITMIDGNPSLRASKQYEDAGITVVDQLQRLWASNTPAIREPVRMCCVFHVLYRSTDRNRPDLMNLLHAPADWMQPAKVGKDGTARSVGAGIIEDDRQVVSVDGSRIVFECDGCPDKRKGCNYVYRVRLKKNGEPWRNRKGKPIRDKIQVCNRAKIEIEIAVLDKEAKA